MNICLYGASSPEIDPVYLDAAYAFGRLLAQHGHTLVYGGGAQGVMGAAARGAYEAGGKITGIAPTFLQVDGILFDHCTEFLHHGRAQDRHDRPCGRVRHGPGRLRHAGGVF